MSMFRQSHQLPRIDLSAHQIQSLSLSLSTAWDEDLADLFGWGDLAGELLGWDDEGEEPPLVITYRRHKVKYTITLVASPSLTHDEQLTVIIRYATVPPNLPAEASIFPDESGRESDLLREIAGIEPAEPIQATVEFAFGPLPDSDLWYPLPRRIGEPPSPLFELRGVRGAKLDAAGEHDAYTFTLDRTDDNDVALFVRIPYDQPFSTQAPERVIEQAEAIAHELVRR